MELCALDTGGRLHCRPKQSSMFLKCCQSVLQRLCHPNPKRGSGLGREYESLTWQSGEALDELLELNNSLRHREGVQVAVNRVDVAFILVIEDVCACNATCPHLLQPLAALQALHIQAKSGNQLKVWSNNQIQTRECPHKSRCCALGQHPTFNSVTAQPAQTPAH